MALAKFIQVIRFLILLDNMLQLLLDIKTRINILYDLWAQGMWFRNHRVIPGNSLAATVLDTCLNEVTINGNLETITYYYYRLDLSGSQYMYWSNLSIWQIARYIHKWQSFSKDYHACFEKIVKWFSAAFYMYVIKRFHSLIMVSMED